MPLKEENPMEVYVARQPIFRNNKKIHGYEVLFRDGISNFFPKDVDGRRASSTVLSNTFLSIGLEELTGGPPAFVNFPKELILNRIPLMFPPKSLVIEILEEVEPSEEVVEACRNFVAKGYVIALDDFIYSAGYSKLLSLSKIVKLDFRALPPEQLKSTVKKLAPYGLQLLAEKVETHEEFLQARQMGFSLFQGYFFSKPEVVKGKDTTTPKMSLLQIMAEANKEDVEISKLGAAITRDVAISYKLLRYVNSAFFRRLQDITSIGQAIFMLGENQIRRFISLIAMASLGADKPGELIRASATRAKFCELAGGLDGFKGMSAELFTLGLFSLIDAILDDSMENLMARLPLSDPIKKALVSGSGPIAGFINLASSYEKGDWAEVAATAAALGISESELPRCFMEALAWSNALSGI
jgi:c-di-GMP-related signal transduction protein